MEKVIKINNRDVTFKSTGATLLRYKSQFKKDFLKEIVKISEIDDMEDGVAVFEKIDMQTVYEFIWVLAKTADNNVPPLLEWLDTFDEFPVLEIFMELQDLILSSVQSTSNKPSVSKRK